VDLEASATRAVGSAPIVGPTDAAERGVRFLIRHARHGAQGERLGGCGKEEMLSHVSTKYDVL
jgi:hypothetical protein